MSPPERVPLCPTKGGCWYCCKSRGADYDDWAFDGEFDTFVHLSCLRQADETTPKDSPGRVEVDCMLYLLRDQVKT